MVEINETSPTPVTEVEVEGNIDTVNEKSNDWINIVGSNGLKKKVSLNY